MTLLSLKAIETALPGERFIKAQKSFLVAKDKIESVEGNVLCIGQHKIPISRKWRNDILNAIVSGKLMASLAHLAILIFSSLPIVMLCLPLGGVSIYEVLAAYLALVL